MDISAWHLPAADVAWENRVVAERDGVRVLAPALAVSDIDNVCRQLLKAHERLADVPVDRVITAIDAAARTLLDPTARARDDALAGLTAVSGFSHAMATRLLDRATQDWLRPSLEQLVEAELGGAAAIEGFVYRAPGVRSRAVAAPLGFHVFSANVPGVSVTSIVRALLVRSAVFGKSAAAEPVLAAVFARLLAEADPLIGECVAVTWWSGGDEAREAAVLEHARLVVHYGGADAIASLRGRVRDDVRFVEHGPRLSFAIIGAAATRVDEAAAVVDEAAADLAEAVALFDQQGCVSPQMAFVIGDEGAAVAFAGRVAHQLQRLQEVLPRGRLEPAEAAAIRRLRTRAEFDSIRGGSTRIWEGRDLAWTVLSSTEPDFRASCLNRTLIVRNAAAIDDVIDYVRPAAAFLQSVGIAGFDDAERATIADRLASVGVSRATSIAAMPWPPVTWHHDGRGPLHELVRWVDLEDPRGQAGSDDRNTSRI